MRLKVFIELYYGEKSISDLYPKFGILAVLNIMLVRKLRENLCPQPTKKMILYKWVETLHLGFS